MRRSKRSKADTLNEFSSICSGHVDYVWNNLLPRATASCDTELRFILYWKSCLQSNRINEVSRDGRYTGRSGQPSESCRHENNPHL